MSAGHSGVLNRILIVDDDVDLLMLLERKLVKQGFEVETAASLPEAEEILQYFRPHLLLLDINVRGEDGRKLSFKLKQDTTHKGCRIIILSGYDYSASRAALFGADELITKPLHLAYLLHRIEHYLFNGSQGVYEPGPI
ncbi:MAG: hypothetical protein JWP69_514 [Flaviaesturariibacter sp.]|nr:hypothetical protein [Flaviaesturariibacter sp.]